VLKIILPLALALSSTFAQTKSKALPPQGTTASQPVGATQDVRIEAEIRSRLAKSVIGKDGFTVRVQGGIAYWEGSTEVVQHKGSATRMAKSAGAKKVVNNIKVGDAAKQTASSNLEQGRRRVQVKRSDPR
jgi:hypothetical protein